MPGYEADYELQMILGDNLDNVFDDLPGWTHIVGYDGDDLIYASAEDEYAGKHEQTGNDTFLGGDGSDTISYLKVVDTPIVASLFAGFGHRHVQGEGLDFYDYYEDIENLHGSNYSDSLYGDNSANQIFAFKGDDYVNGYGGDDIINGGDGKDTILGGDGSDTLDGSDGADKIHGGGDGDTIYGGDGKDTLNGNDGVDTIHGGAGKDEINGGAHGDIIHGDEDEDTLRGGDGDDTLDGGSENDTLEGGSGDDTMDGGAGIDWAVWRTSNDVEVHLYEEYATSELGTDTLINIENIQTGSGMDTIFGNDGDNVYWTGGGADTILTLGGNDIIYSGGGGDTILGYNGVEEVHSGEGGDHITTNGGDDVIIAGSGNDFIVSGSGNDTITTGGDADEIRWEDGESLGFDHILDFNLGVDKLSFEAGFLSDDPDPTGDLSSLLDVQDAAQAGNSVLLAHFNTGWNAIAEFKNVSVEDLSDAIADHSLLNFDPLPDDGVGGGGIDEFAWA